MVTVPGILAPATASAAPTPITAANRFTVNSPVVALPGKTVVLSMWLGNLTATPAPARAQLYGYCYTSAHTRADFQAAVQVVTVPGDPERVKGVAPLRLVRSVVTIPATCVHDSTRAIDGEFLGDFGSPGVSPIGTKFSHFWIGLPFTNANKIHNLTLKTKGRPSPYQAHHTMPQKFEAKFKARGLNIHDPVYLRWWCSKVGVPTNHSSNAYKYNRLWDTFFAGKPNATKAEILQYRTSIQGMFTYSC
ncbi:hypothetical protein [Kribbella sp. CA-293567]|uniref:hypothetical protein n=1 Tax=Kribbella sp. CA-293567 TaxID=3002436 RepID=UPI0022DE0A36|nr:hypothetical protein [Kribbella sp. CA-293567]WBQ08472.1 hypothetical protein OX958_17040 [Kribbella sp. CA-293567]